MEVVLRYVVVRHRTGPDLFEAHIPDFFDIGAGSGAHRTAEAAAIVACRHLCACYDDSRIVAVPPAEPLSVEAAKEACAREWRDVVAEWRDEDADADPVMRDVTVSFVRATVRGGRVVRADHESCA